jgi:hypothetical protein
MGQSSLNVETKQTGQLVEILCQVALSLVVTFFGSISGRGQSQAF